MEASSCVKAVAGAANQFLRCKNETSQIQLQRQLDVLISITGEGQNLLSFFHPNEFLSTECLSNLVEILTQDYSQAYRALANKILTLFSNIAKEEQIREALHSKFDLTSCLASLLRHQDASSCNQVVLQCAIVMEQLTYSAKVSSQEPYVEDLVKFLYKNIVGKDSKLTKPCLGILANLCKHFSMQTYVKTLENVTTLYKNLIANLSKSDQTTVILSLNSLASLTLYSDLGDKVFNANNIHQTLQLIFQILIDGDKNTTRRYAIDLLSDLMKHSKIQEALTLYQHLDVCTKEILSFLCEADQDSVSQVFELLLCLCTVNGIRRVICKCLFSSPGLNNNMSFSTLLKQDSVNEPLFGVLRWATLSVESYGQVPIQALDFLREIFEEAIDQGLTYPNPRLDLVLPLIIEVLESQGCQRDPTVIKRSCCKIVKGIKLLIALCSDDTTKHLVAQSIDIRKYSQLLEQQFANNSVKYSPEQGNGLQDWSEAGVDIVLYTLDLMGSIQTLIPELGQELNTILQDTRLVPFLANGITSQHRERVQAALSLILKGSKLDEFPNLMLGDTISTNNTTRQISEDVSKNNSDSSFSTFSTFRDSHTVRPFQAKENIITNPTNGKRSASNSELDMSVQHLIDKMQNGFELKDMRASEIISLYEHQLQSIQTKENHLQDLLEAKTAALAQADRLISQFRTRRAQSEAESHKLRSLLQESESRSERCKEELSEIRLHKDNMENVISRLTEENTRLESVASEHPRLSQAVAELSERLKSTERDLSLLKMEHSTLSEMHETLRKHCETQSDLLETRERELASLKREHATATQMQETLKKHCDTLKQQNDKSSAQLEELEKERKTLSGQVKEYTAKIKEFNKLNKKLENELAKVTSERDQLAAELTTTKQDLMKKEKLRKDLQHQVSSLDLVCRQHEATIKEKEEAITSHEETIASLRSDLGQHAQLAAMIHNMTGGKSEKK